jgi:hypothetical protein
MHAIFFVAVGKPCFFYLNTLEKNREASLVSL